MMNINQTNQGQEGLNTEDFLKHKQVRDFCMQVTEKNQHFSFSFKSIICQDSRA